MAKKFLDKEGLVTLWGKVKDWVLKRINNGRPKVSLTLTRIGYASGAPALYTNITVMQNHLLLIGLYHGPVANGPKSPFAGDTVTLLTSELIKGGSAQYNYIIGEGNKSLAVPMKFSIDGDGTLNISIAENHQTEVDRSLYVTHIVQVPLYV